LKKTFLITLIILVLDQWLKIWVKLNFTLGEEVPVVGNWFKLYFTENNGMAFGLEFAGQWGKLNFSLRFAENQYDIKPDQAVLSLLHILDDHEH